MAASFFFRTMMNLLKRIVGLQQRKSITPEIIFSPLIAVMRLQYAGGRMAIICPFFVAKCGMLGRKFTSLMACASGHERTRTDEADAMSCVAQSRPISTPGIGGIKAQMN